jgi:predicted nucleic acid-binding protein
VAEAAVVKASPLIVLAKAGHLELLRVAAARIVVPRTVLAEIDRGPTGDPTSSAVRDAPWLEPVDAAPVPQTIAQLDLGAGESAVIAWAYGNPPCALILDDAAARRGAGSLGLTVKGTLSLITTAKQQGGVSSAAAVVADLRAAGLWVSNQLVTKLLTSVGE